MRLAAFASAIGSLLPPAMATLASRHPGLQVSLTDTHPPEAIELLRTGKVDVAIIFRYDHTESELPGWERHISAATYGAPPDPPATAALLTALTEAAGALA